MVRLRLNLSFLATWRGGCKFSHKCHLYSSQNHTCTNKGGSYCGKYREFNAKQQPAGAGALGIEQKKEEVTFVINPAVYEPIETEANDE